jgi:hypothetical protein
MSNTYIVRKKNGETIKVSGINNVKVENNQAIFLNENNQVVASFTTTEYDSFHVEEASTPSSFSKSELLFS